MIPISFWSLVLMDSDQGSAPRMAFLSFMSLFQSMPISLAVVQRWVR